MAENIIKDFVKKQTTTLTIGTPRQRPLASEEQSDTPATAAPAPEPVQPVREAPAAVVAAQEAATSEQPVRGRVGRPRSGIEKKKMSVYVPEEVKEKLIKLQHMTYKQSINDVLIEGIYLLLKKYDL